MMGYSVAEELKENPFGVTEVFSTPEAVVDVVLVHGLTGHPYNTWTTDDHRVFWPTDLLPTNAKKARILVYGYDADVASFKEGVSKDKIHNHAETLVQRLSANRSLEDVTDRPIIFICHSLGGLVVKRALSYSFNITNPKLEQQRSIYVSTFGIIFLGTPHNGSDLAKWGSFFESIASIAPRRILDSQPQLVEALKSQSETLQNINRYFESIMDRFHMLFCHEGKPTSVKGTRQFVVDEDSAAPGFAVGERMVIEADHSHMCKFASKRSPGYEGVAEAVKRFAAEAPGTIETRWSEEKNARGHWLKAQANELIPKGPGNSTGNSPRLGNTSTAGNSTTSLPWKEPVSLGFSQTTEVVSINPQISEPLLIAPPTFRPNSLFYGMEDELQELDRKLFKAEKRADGTACVLIWCPPGGGKSHLAREYVFTHRNAFPGGIFWIDARLRGNRFQGFWEVAQGAAMKDLHDPGENKESEATFVKTVKEWFEARQEWLLVFDGISFDKDEDITEFQKFIPDSKNSSIIYTSVDRTLERTQRLLDPIAVKVRPLHERYAMELLYRGLGIRQPTAEQDEKARALVRYLECLPLAIRAMGHRLSATGKAIEKYRIESYSTDSKLAQPYMGIMADLRRYNHTEALNLIHILCFFAHNVPVAMLGLGRQMLKEANIYIKSSDRGIKRDVDTTLGTLIKYGLIDRALIRYDVVDRSTPDLSDGRQGSQDSLVSTLETIDIIKIHTVVQGFCCDSLKEEGQFIYWLEVAVKMFCHSFDKADAQIRKQSMPGLVKDYREYETHGQRLLSHFVEKLARTPALRETRAKLQRSLLKIKKEIQSRSPGSSQESFRPQASIFDRTTSTSDDSLDTPKSTPSRVSTLGLGSEKPPVDSPLSLDGHYDRGPITFEKSDSTPIPEYPDDPGYTADREELQAPYPLTPTRSEDTARPHNSTSLNHESGWQLVSRKKKMSKSRLSKVGKSAVASIKRPRVRRDLGSFHPTVPRPAINTTPAVGTTSRARAESRGWASASSEAVTSLLHNASPSRGGRTTVSGRPSSRSPLSQTRMNSSEKTWLREESPARVPLPQVSPNLPSSIPSRTSPALEEMQRGRSREVFRSRQGNVQPSPLAAEFVPQSHVTQSAHNQVDPYELPPAVASNHQTPVSSPGFNYSYQYHSSDPNLSSMPHVFAFNENDSSSRPLPQISNRPNPFPYETGITITAKRRLPPDFRGHHHPATGNYQQYPSPATPRYLPQLPYPQNPPMFFSAPPPDGYSSQPMSRNPSGQSNPYPATEPPPYPPSFSPHLADTATPMSPRDRLPDGCPPRKSPKFANAFPVYRGDDIFEQPAMMNDPRFSTDDAIAGMGTWATAPEPVSPISPSTTTTPHDLSMSMSRSTSGPGIALPGNQGLGFAPFGFAFGGSGNGYVRFGQHDPISLDEARQRTSEHSRRLMAEFEQGAFRPELRQRRSGVGGRGNYNVGGGVGLHTGDGVGGIGGGMSAAAHGGGNGLSTGLQQPCPDINLIPTPSDEIALRNLVEFDGRRRGLSAPGYRGDLVGLQGFGVEFEDQFR